MVPDTPNPKEGQAFELSPLVEQPQSPNGHPSLQPAQYQRKENPVMVLVRLQYSICNHPCMNVTKIPLMVTARKALIVHLCLWHSM